MAERPTLFAATLLVILQAISALHWTGNVQGDLILHACVGDDVTINWQYAADPQDSIFSISWFFDGRSQEMVAMSSHGAFVPLPAFGSRVQQTTNAGVKISKVSMGDSGRYTVEINGQDAHGAFTVNQHLQLQVADDLLTSDHQLHVTQSPQAVQDDVTKEWHVQLNCGTFTYAGPPPFQVQWMSPSGARYNSTGYHDNQFQFVVPNPVEEGSYTCEIPQQFSVRACLPDGQTAASEFAVHGVQSRLTLMEANQQGLRQQNQMLQSLNRQLRANQAAVDQQIAALEALQQQQQQQMTADGHCCQDTRTRVDTLNHDIQTHVAKTHNDTAAVTSQLQSLISHATTSQPQSTADVSFHAHMQALLNIANGIFGHGGDMVVAEERTPYDVNQGNGLDGRSPKFTAPVNGTYFIVASSILHSTNVTLINQYLLPVQLWKDGQLLAEGETICEAVVNLAKGEVVQLQPVHHRLAAWGSGGVLGAALSDLLFLRVHPFDVYVDGFLVR